MCAIRLKKCGLFTAFILYAHWAAWAADSLMITDVNQPSNRVVIANRPTTLSMSVTGSPPPTLQWFFEPETGGGFNPVVDGDGVSGATNASLTISNMAPYNAGSYF